MDSHHGARRQAQAQALEPGLPAARRLVPVAVDQYVRLAPPRAESLQPGEQQPAGPTVGDDPAAAVTPGEQAQGHDHPTQVVGPPVPQATGKPGGRARGPDAWQNLPLPAKT